MWFWINFVTYNYIQVQSKWFIHQSSLYQRGLHRFYSYIQVYGASYAKGLDPCELNIQYCSRCLSSTSTMTIPVLPVLLFNGHAWFQLPRQPLILHVPDFSNKTVLNVQHRNNVNHQEQLLSGTFNYNCEIRVYQAKCIHGRCGCGWKTTAHPTLPLYNNLHHQSFVSTIFFCLDDWLAAGLILWLNTRRYATPETNLRSEWHIKLFCRAVTDLLLQPVSSRTTACAKHRQSFQSEWPVC